MGSGQGLSKVGRREVLSTGLEVSLWKMCCTERRLAEQRDKYIWLSAIKVQPILMLRGRAK